MGMNNNEKHMLAAIVRGTSRLVDGYKIDSIVGMKNRSRNTYAIACHLQRLCGYPEKYPRPRKSAGWRLRISTLLIRIAILINP